jgi:hypothetical protein
MNARHLVVAIAVPAIAVAAAVTAAAIPSQQHHGHHQEASASPSHSQLADVGLEREAAFQQLTGSHGHHASSSNQHGHTRGAAQHGVDELFSTMANVDYDAFGGYGQYDPAALHDSWVQGVDINMDWSSVEASPGSFNWGPLDSTAAAWANAGKRVVLVVRAANETGGGCSAQPGQFLPGWEITALHNALGNIGTFCDKTLDSLVPDWFSATFQSNFQAFISALGAHVSSQSWYSSISYVRIGVGLGGESFYLFPQNGYNADKSWMEANWGYTPQAWANFQETMLTAYHAAFPSPVQVIYPLDELDNIAPNDPGDVAVAEWATNNGMGVGEECLPPGGLNSAFNPVLGWVRENHPGAYIQFQTCGGTPTASDEESIIQAAEGYGAKSIEWYEGTIVSPPSEADMSAYESWANSTFGG